MARPLRTTFPRVAGLLLAAASGAVIMGWFAASHPAPPPPPPALVSVEGMGHLVSVRVRHANVIEYTEQLTQGIPWTQWELRLGGTRVLLVARGDCLVGIDLRQARYEAVDAQARTAVLQLPGPAVISARVDHRPREQGGSYFYAVQGTGIEPLLPGSGNRTQAIGAALAQAQRDVERSCSAAPMLAGARENAEAVLTPLLAATGWKVQLRWS